MKWLLLEVSCRSYQKALGDVRYLNILDLDSSAGLDGEGELLIPNMEEHSSSSETLPLSPGRHIAMKCGWLRKQGGFVKTWHTRWFVLKGDQLYYFKDEDETKPLTKNVNLNFQ
ncbi:rho GTPase-activating protein 24-like protein [Willisornis vidua]|uniref:Rho GTPase-activating protein 24-like protein n=1 Tax=Willisornis vidua TaxID=1566151 RepID=A0ABQ9CVU2_9PASS|nr:rho GTPase-activating protein 24-like protein [Willisornis vidua]